ncbi:MAG: Asp-tRNA(Asn)/Glu-tRNA(Gln) amidotransferase GatCAB subunit A, partial [Actinobacteria bacterium]|nr:Asp-tRNA(Asn)/Glu-tRNA(Gln) amidotransferase GatCAB subunit A [Actinomycetota bacterium]
MEPNDVTAAAEAVRTGEVSARELVEDSLERIDRGDGPLNAFVHLDPDGALAAADRID